MKQITITSEEVNEIIRENPSPFEAIFNTGSLVYTKLNNAIEDPIADAVNDLEKGEEKWEEKGKPIKVEIADYEVNKIIGECNFNTQRISIKIADLVLTKLNAKLENEVKSNA